MEHNVPYPIQLDITDADIVIVGGGSVADRRIPRLLADGANVTVIAPEVTDSIAELADDCEIIWRQRTYDTGDLTGARLAFAATDDPEVNRQVADDARKAGIPVNVADRSADGDFAVPAVATFERLQLAIDTGGASPALSGALRRHLEQRLDPKWDRAADILARMRPDAVEHLAADDRRRLFRQLVDDLASCELDNRHEWLVWLTTAAEHAGLAEDALDWRSYLPTDDPPA